MSGRCPRLTRVSAITNNSVSAISCVPNIDKASEAVTCGDRTGGEGEADPAGA